MSLHPPKMHLLVEPHCDMNPQKHPTSCWWGLLRAKPCFIGPMALGGQLFLEGFQLIWWPTHAHGA